MRSVGERVSAIEKEIRAIAHDIHENPETGMEEYRAVQLLTDVLERYGFEVTRPVCALETAFIAGYRGNKPGPVIGYLAEYDALAGMGHGCGHNMIGALACCCAIALRDAVDEYGGEVRVIGAPAEETLGGKVTLARDGCYDDLTVAMMAHPFGRHAASGGMYAVDSERFEFYGRAAHAAGHPEDGINALNAVIETFNAINALRQHTPSTAKISGIIRNGGTAANIVPDYASAEFYIRAADSAGLDRLSEQVKNCARGAALATGTRLEITSFEGRYESLRTNRTLCDRAVYHTKQLGVHSMEPYMSTASSDVGNVSHRCPTIHQWMDVTGDEKICTHTPEMVRCCDSDYGYRQMFLTARALVATAEDVLTDENLRTAIKNEFDEAADRR